MKNKKATTATATATNTESGDANYLRVIPLYPFDMTREQWTEWQRFEYRKAAMQGLIVNNDPMEPEWISSVAHQITEQMLKEGDKESMNALTGVDGCVTNGPIRKVTNE